MRTKIKNLLTGQVKDQTFRSGEKINEVRVVRQPFQFLYASGGLYHVMDRTSYEQIELNENMVGDAKDYLKENMNLDILMDGDKPLAIELPNFVEMAVTSAEPGFRGDTARGGSKPATLESGSRGTSAVVHQRGRRGSRRHPYRRVRDARLARTLGQAILSKGR